MNKTSESHVHSPTIDTCDICERTVPVCEMSYHEVPNMSALGACRSCHEGQRRDRYDASSREAYEARGGYGS